MFVKGSRYRNMPTYETTDALGRTVKAVALPLPSKAAPAGEYVLQEGERLDHLAARFLDDATAFWRICDANDAMHPDEVFAADKPLIIPAQES